MVQNGQVFVSGAEEFRSERHIGDSPLQYEEQGSLVSNCGWVYLADDQRHVADDGSVKLAKCRQHSGGQWVALMAGHIYKYQLGRRVTGQLVFMSSVAMALSGWKLITCPPRVV